MNQSATTLHPAQGPLRGHLQIPGDKSISHRSIMLSSVCHGTSRVSGFLVAGDTLSTVGVFRALGVEIDVQGTDVTVHGRGPEALRPSAAPLDCGNSGTTMRLVTGMLTGLALEATLIGDESLSARPMKRISAPLGRFGGLVHTTDGRAPLRIDPSSAFTGGHHDQKIASAQVKSSLLLAALLSGQPMTLTEPHASRDHTEHMLRALGVPVVSSAHYSGAPTSGPARVELPAWSAPLQARDIQVPADISSAAFLAVAAALVPGSDLILPGVGVAPTRAGLLTILKRAGAKLTISNKRRTGGGEEVADLHLGHGPLRAFEINAPDVPTLVDEIPVLALLAATAQGRSTFKDIGELRVKECDRLARTAHLLRQCGIDVEEGDDWMAIEGRGQRPLKAFEGFDAQHDHRMAAAAIIAALVADGPCSAVGLDALRISYPGFGDDLERLQRGQG